MENKLFLLAKTIIVVAILWTILTLVVQTTGPEKTTVWGSAEGQRSALVVYDPDPIYNLDEQVCEGFANGLAQQNNWLAKVMTVAAAKKVEADFDLYVFCANTYNWAPDRAVTNFIRKHENLENKAVVAITLGSGSTQRSQALLEEEIKQKKAMLLASKAYWLMKPNNESRLKEGNVQVAVDMATTLGLETARQFEVLYSSHN